MNWALIYFATGMLYLMWGIAGAPDSEREELFGKYGPVFVAIGIAILSAFWLPMALYSLFVWLRSPRR